AVDSSRGLIYAEANNGGSNSVLYVIQDPAPPGAIFVGNNGNNSVTAYPLGSNGNVGPVTRISGTNTKLNGALGVALDPTGNLYVTGCGGPCGGSGAGSFTTYQAGSNGDVTPFTAVAGSNTGFITANGIARDASGKIYVVDNTGNSIKVFSAGSNGNVAPIATISGGNTLLTRPNLIALDAGGNIYVTNFFGGPPNCNSDTLGCGSVTEYAAGASDNATPIATIAGANTMLSGPVGVAVDPTTGNIYVGNEGNGTPGGVVIYSPGSGNRNVAPIASISGTNTGISSAQGVALDSDLNIYVVHDGSSVSEFAPLGSSTGNLNEKPIADITGYNTGLSGADGITIAP